MASSNIEAMKNTDEAFAEVEDGVAEVMAAERADYSGGKASRVDAVKEMNERARAALYEHIEVINAESKDLGVKLDALKGRKVDADEAIAAIDASLTHIENIENIEKK